MVHRVAGTPEDDQKAAEKRRGSQIAKSKGGCCHEAEVDATVKVLKLFVGAALNEAHGCAKAYDGDDNWRSRVQHIDAGNGGHDGCRRIGGDGHQRKATLIICARRACQRQAQAPSSRAPRPELAGPCP